MKKIIALILLAFVLALAACGGGGESADSGGGPVTLDFEGQDIAFDKTSATVNANEQVTINFNNVGTLEHSWVLIPGNADPLTATEADALGGASSGTVAGGESVSFTFTAPPPGEYQFVCTIEGHAAAGMVGTLTSQ